MIIKFKLVFYLLVFLTLESVLPVLAQKAKSNLKTITVIIDAGHGGKDPGKPRGSEILKHEKDLNLAIALKVGAYIEEKVEGVKVIYTRKDDSEVSLESRVDIANNAKADYFISIHCNSNPNSAIYGTKTHIHSNSFKDSYALAIRVENEFNARAGRLSRGINSSKDRGHNLYVLQYSNMPGVLIEVGFMSNKKEEIYLNSEYGQDILASAIYRSFRDFLAEKHPEERREEFYRIQIMASDKPVPLDSSQFEKLGMKVEEHKADDPKDKFKYKYVVGREYDNTAALTLQKKVREKGFKDAFVITIKNDN